MSEAVGRKSSPAHQERSTETTALPMSPLARTTRGLRTAVYRRLLTMMFRVDPEQIHTMMTTSLERVSRSRLGVFAITRLFAVDDAALAQTIAGMHVPRPLGLAAGFDKDAREVNVWGAFGFGFAEIGTVTAVRQPGNPQPRLFRLPADRALLNRMGFNNEGAAVAALRLKERRTDIPIGANLGKSKRTDPSVAERDYLKSTRAIAGVADYLVINVSSPNTPGLRDLQAVESLRPIIAAVQSESSKPLFVKIAPDLSDADVDAVTDLCLDMGVTGMIATNTTISRDGLSTPTETVTELGAGGISGAPLAQRSLEVLRRVRQRAEDRLVLIGVGGIETPQQAWERIAAGANLLQGYTGLIYGGPDWIRDIHIALGRQLRAHGLKNISEAVGSELPWTLR